MNLRILLIILLTVSVRIELYAQANCTLPLPNCINNFGTNAVGGVNLPFGSLINSSPSTMIPDWSVLLGTPVLDTGMNHSTGINMVSDDGNGEGVYTCYDFHSGKKYNICFHAFNLTSESRGELILEASDGATTQVIHSDTFYHPTPYPQFQYSFVASQHFTQLRIRTNWTNGYTAHSSNPYSVVIDDIQVVEAPVLTANLSTVNACQSVTITANSDNQLEISSWSPANVSPSSGNSPGSYTSYPCNTTTYIASYTSSCPGSCTNTEQVTVNVQPGTSVTASPSVVGRCQNATLTASSIEPMSVTWSPTIGLDSTIGNVVNAQPCYTASYIASFHCPYNGCVYNQPVTVNVQPVGSIVNNTLVIPCLGPINMYFAGNACPGSKYTWIGPQHNVMSTNATLSRSVTTRGDEGSYMLKITSPQNCIDTYYTVVQMTGCCNVVSDFEIVGCNPIRIVNNTAANGIPVLEGEWHWDLGDGTSSSIRNPAHLYTTKLGHNEVCLTAIASDGISTCCDKLCKEFEICDFGPCIFAAAFDYRVVNPGTNDIQFMDKSASPSPACSWTWTIDGTIMSTIQNPVISLGSGTHNVCLLVGCGTLCPKNEACEDIVIP